MLWDARFPPASVGSDPLRTLLTRGMVRPGEVLINRIARLAGAILLTSSAAALVAAPAAKNDYLFVWATDIGAKKSDFLAVIDVDESSPRYGEVIATAPTGVPLSIAHHTEHEMPKGGVLFANGFGAGQTFLFDLHDPLHPKVASSFLGADDFMHPHSFAREPNGNVLATYQMRGHDNAEPGALVELDASRPPPIQKASRSSGRIAWQ